MKFTGIVIEENRSTLLDVNMEETSLTIGQDVVIVGEKPLLDLGLGVVITCVILVVWLGMIAFDKTSSKTEHESADSAN